MVLIYSSGSNEQYLIFVVKDAVSCNSKDSELLIKGDIMKDVKDVFLVFAFAL